MDIHISTDDVPEAERLEYWQQAICKAFAPCELQVEQETSYQGRLVSSNLGAVQVARISSSPTKVLRPSRLISESDPESYRLDLQLRDQRIVSQGGREARLYPGDFTLYDMTRPYYLTCAKGSTQEALALTFPRTLLPIPVIKVTSITAVPILGNQGTAALISYFLRQLAKELGKVDYNPAERVYLSTAVLDLIVAALAGRLDSNVAVSSGTRHRALMLRITSFMEEHLDDPNLSPSAIAAAHQISLRYLHKLFADNGFKVSAWIRDRRLERCRQALSDPVQMSQPVGSIGARWGFVNATHFSRVFRDAFGVAPREYRLLHTGAETTRGTRASAHDILPACEGPELIGRSKFG